MNTVECSKFYELKNSAAFAIAATTETSSTSPQSKRTQNDRLPQTVMSPLSGVQTLPMTPAMEAAIAECVEHRRIDRLLGQT